MADEVILLAPRETSVYAVSGAATAAVFVGESQAYSMFIAPGLASALKVPMQAMVAQAIQVFQSGVFVDGVFT